MKCIILKVFIGFALVFSIHAAQESEYAENFSEPSAVQIPEKESWWKFGKRHATNVAQAVKNLAHATSAGIESMHPDQYDDQSSTSLQKDIHLTFHKPEKDTASSSVFTPALPVAQNVESNPLFVEEPKAEESKAWASWLQGVISEFNSDVDSYEGDWDYATKGITQQDIDSVGADTQIVGCALMPESLVKIQNLHTLMSSWKFVPVKTALMPIFPIGKLQELVSDLATSKVIPADIGQRIEEITSKIALLPHGAKRALNVAAMIKVLPKDEAIAYASETLPALVPLINVRQDVLKAQEILQEHSQDPVQALRQLHDQGLETLKTLKIDKVLKVIDNAAESKTNALEKTAKINRIVTDTTTILFALALGSMVLSIIEGVTHNVVVRKIMEFIMIFDLAAIAGGIGYGGSKLSYLLQPASPSHVNVEPVVADTNIQPVPSSSTTEESSDFIMG